MPDNDVSRAAISTALFIDFDNVYSSLRKVNAQAADRFARDPARWLQWFQDGGHESYEEDGPASQRRVVVRRCYLNPAAYGNQRAAFVRSGFSVIDCPSLTAQGKSSADIYMVMDIMDSLHHKTMFEEFIILSSDADFTPVLLRLREHMRRTTIIANAMAAAALKSACDYVVPQDAFIEEALGIEETEAPVPGLGEQPSPVLVPRAAAAPPKVVVALEHQKLKQQVTEYLRNALAQSDRGILLSALGINIPKTLGPVVKETRWCGCGSLTTLVKELQHAAGFTYVPAGARSYIYDAVRHKPLQLEEFEPDFAGVAPELVEFIERMNKSIGLPRLLPADYRRVTDFIAAELQSGFTGNLALSARVRDMCQVSGHSISRSSINFVLTGLTYSGFDFTQPPTGGRVVARAFRDNALNLSRNAQLTLSEQELDMLDHWLAGEEPAPDAAVPAMSTAVAGGDGVPVDSHGQ